MTYSIFFLQERLDGNHYKQSQVIIRITPDWQIFARRFSQNTRYSEANMFVFLFMCTSILQRCEILWNITKCNIIQALKFVLFLHVARFSWRFIRIKIVRLNYCVVLLSDKLVIISPFPGTIVHDRHYRGIIINFSLFLFLKDFHKSCNRNRNISVLL